MGVAERKGDYIYDEGEDEERLENVKEEEDGIDGKQRDGGSRETERKGKREDCDRLGRLGYIGDGRGRKSNW